MLLQKSYEPNCAAAYWSLKSSIKSTLDRSKATACLKHSDCKTASRSSVNYAYSTDKRTDAWWDIFMI